MEGTINWLDSCIVCAVRQERRKEGMPPGMFGSLLKLEHSNCLIKNCQKMFIIMTLFSY